MRTIRIALAQINVTVGELKANVQKIVRFIEEARRLEANLVVFPELAVSGYPPEDLLLKPAFIRACRESLDMIARAARDIIVVVGYPEADGDLYNAAAILADGKVTGNYRKHYLPNYGVFDEDRYFASSHENFVFQTDGVRFGVSICEDIWYPAGPHEAQAVLGGAELLVNISASPYYRGKVGERERMLTVRATDSVAALAFCNLVGGQDELVFDGASVVLDAAGKVLARGKQFEEDLVVADIEHESLLRHRLSDPRARKERLQLRMAQISFKETTLPVKLRWEKASLEPGEVRPLLPEPAEIYRALVLGTRDYLRKNGFLKAVMGLSGGIDSSLVACIAADALGPENVVGISMPSQYSSPHSQEDASQLAKMLGIRFLSIPIQSAHQAFLEMLAPIFEKRELDVTEENLQSRIRGTLLMALSNKFGWLVLTTGNKSEMSVGYSTLYGDMAGGFAVIKDVPKILVYDLARYRNSLNPIIPENVFRKPPSAELRPNQTDQDTLPDYAELDPILAAYMEQNWSLPEMLSNGFAPGTVKKVVKMVDHAEYKRRQAPPGIKITRRALGKDWRLPVTNRFVEDDG